jgi:hypothetical protein
MSILCLSLDYCDIYTSSEKKRRFMMLFFLGGGGWYGVSNWVRNITAVLYS